MYQFRVFVFISFVLAFVFAGLGNLLHSQATAPYADAGFDKYFDIGQTVKLDASGSLSPDAQPLSYEWVVLARPEGSIAQPSNTDHPITDFTPDIDGDYEIELTVTDGAGVPSVDYVKLSTANLAPLAVAGMDRVALIGKPVLLSPEGSFDANGDALTTQWIITNKPENSEALIAINENGRFEMMPDIAGIYNVELTVADTQGLESVDDVNIYVDVPINLAPKAVAGEDRQFFTGSPVVLDGSRSFDIDGDKLAYSWALISAPEASTFNFPGSSEPSVEISGLTQGDWIFQLTVTDSQSNTDYDTVLLSSGAVKPLPVIGGETPSSLGLLADNMGELFGSFSQSSFGFNFYLDYEWSAFELSSGEAVIEDASLAETQISFPLEKPGLIDNANATHAIDFLRAVSAVSETEYHLQSRVYGPLHIGGDLKVTRGDIFSNDDGAYQQSVIVGDVKGQSLIVRGGGDLLYGGKFNARVSFTDGGEAVRGQDPTFQQNFANAVILSNEFSGLEVNGDVVFGNKGKTLTLSANDAEGVAIFNISASQGNLAKLNNVELQAGTASAIVINVESDHIVLKGKLGGDFLIPDLASKVIWNFPSAQTIQVQSEHYGAILAPQAYVHVKAPLNGSLVAHRVVQQDEIISFPFSGEGIVRQQLEPAKTALIQLAVTDQDATDWGAQYTSKIYSVGNLAPVAKISVSPNQDIFPPKQEITLASFNSIDPNSDILQAEWAILFTPEGSNAELTSAGAYQTGLTPDVPGTYIVQLRMTDGLEWSAPVTKLFNVVNTPPKADAGDNQEGFINASFTLDGNRSSDVEDDELDYLWTFAAKPTLSQSELDDPMSVSPTFKADRKGEYVLNLQVTDSFGDSGEDSVVITILNQAPIADLAGPDSGFVGQSLTFTAAGSSDPDGDVLNYDWMISGPEGTMARVSTDGSPLASFTPDLAGVYTLTLTVSDGEASSLPVSLTFNVIDKNRAPVFSPLGDQVLTLGATSSFSVSASDPDGDLLGYTVSPLPLPAGASFNQSTGEFIFRPQSAPQTLSLTFTASDGELSAEQIVSVRVDKDDSVASASYSGRVVDAETGEPLSGVTVMVGDVTVITGTDGVFMAFGVSAGDVVICIDPDGVLAPSGQGYGATEFSVNVIAQADNIHPSEIKLYPAIATTTYLTGQDLVLEAPDAFGVRFDIPAGALSGLDDGQTLSMVALTPEMLADIPEAVGACQLFTLSPKSVDVTGEITISAQNYDSLPAGSRVYVWSFRDGAFMVIGTGVVTDNGARITAQITGVKGGQAIALTPARHDVRLAADQAGGVNPPSLFGDGNLQTAYTLPSYNAQSADRAASLVYNSRSASPEIIVSSEVSFGADFTPATVITQIEAGGSLQAFEDHILVDGAQTVRQEAIITAKDIESGRVPFTVLSTAQYSCSRVTVKVTNSYYVKNDTDSPFGSGWTLPELQRLDVDDLTIEEGTGTTTQFIGNAAEPLVEGFDDGFGGWTLLNDHRSFEFRETGGNPAGHLYWTDSVRGQSVFYVAPDEFANRIASYEGGTWNFDLFQNSVTSQFTREIDFVVDTSDPEKSLTFNIPRSAHPGTAWTSYNIPLVHDDDLGYGPGFGWGVYSASTGTARYDLTAEEFSQLLADATRVRIRAEYRTGRESGGIDNVSLRPGVNAPDDLQGFIVAASFEGDLGDFTRLYQLDDGTFIRRYPDGTQMRFNSDGRQTEIVDRNGNSTSYTYDDQDRVSTITDPVGGVTRFVYVAKNLSSIIDPSGRETFFAYDVFGNLMEITNPEGEVTRFDYNANSKLIAETDPRGFITAHNYGVAGVYTGSDRPDGSSVSLSIAKSLGLKNLGTSDAPRRFVPEAERVSTYVDGRGNTKTVEVNEFGSTIRLVDALGREKRFERNAENLVTAVLEPSDVDTSGFIRTELDYNDIGSVIARRDAVGTALQREQIFEYDPQFNQLTRSVDADGFETLITLDDAGNALTITDPLGGQITSTYDDNGLVLSKSDKNGNITSYAYDAFGRLERMTDPSGIITRNVLSAEGNVLVRVEAEGLPEERRSTYGYDTMNRMIVDTGADGNSYGFLYDLNGNQTTSEDPTGITMTYQYDSMDRMARMNDPALGVTLMEYDDDGNMIRMVDALNQATQISYDAENRATSYIDADGQLRRYDLDSRDNIVAVTDARGNTTQIDYDLLDRPIRITNPNGQVWSFTYDARDNRLSMSKPDGVKITSDYDGLGRITQVSSNGGAAAVLRSYDYDAESNLTAANDNLGGVSGAELSFFYDNENRIEKASVSNIFGGNAQNNNFDFAYDTFDRRASMSDSFGGVTAYTYDPVDRVTSIIAPTGQSYDMNYDQAGRLLGRVAPNATEQIRSYELMTGRLSSHTDSGGASVIAGYDYNYTARGNISQIVESGQVSQTRNYSYDALERLTEVDVPNAPSRDESYQLDEEGNRLSSHLSQTHVTDRANRLLSDDDYTYIYDLNGNLIGKRAKRAGLPDWDYAYDDLDLLISVTKDGEVVERYRYDALGRRSLIETFDGADGFTATGLINDGSDRVIDISNVNSPQRRYTHGDNVDEPLLLQTFDGAGQVAESYNYHTDHLGSVRYVTDSAGTVVNAYEYDSYGRPIAAVEAVPQPYRYTAREWDEMAQIYFYRARSYDASTGRFMQEDPIGFLSGDLNLYRYVLSNPLTYTDPTGLTASSQYGSTSSQSTRGVAPAGAIGTRISCVFTALAGFLEISAQPDVDAVDIFIVGTESALACGARGKPKKGKKNKNCNCKCTAGPKRCFAEGTLVHTRDGLVPIEEIQPGDEVKSMDAVTGEIAYKPVIETHINKFDSYGALKLRDETDGSEMTLSVTATHPFYSESREWVHASKLNIGEQLVEDDGGTLTVTAVDFDPSAPISLTYNLTVADYHTYFVGEDGVLVHNGFGSYIIGDGKNYYVGKGDLKRMQASVRRLFPNGASVQKYTPASCDRESFKQEHVSMMILTKGKHPREVPNLLNKILSPGAKY